MYLPPQQAHKQTNKRTHRQFDKPGSSAGSSAGLLSGTAGTAGTGGAAGSGGAAGTAVLLLSTAERFILSTSLAIVTSVSSSKLAQSDISTGVCGSTTNQNTVLTPRDMNQPIRTQYLHHVT